MHSRASDASLNALVVVDDNRRLVRLHVNSDHSRVGLVAAVGRDVQLAVVIRRAVGVLDGRRSRKVVQGRRVEIDQELRRAEVRDEEELVLLRDINQSLVWEESCEHRADHR